VTRRAQKTLVKPIVAPAVLRRDGIPHDLGRERALEVLRLVARGLLRRHDAHTVLVAQGRTVTVRLQHRPARWRRWEGQEEPRVSASQRTHPRSLAVLTGVIADHELDAADVALLHVQHLPHHRHQRRPRTPGARPVHAHASRLVL
jgi:hypothetical protein